MFHWTLEEHQLPLRYTWKIHQGAANQKTIFLLKVEQKGFSGYGEIAGITRAVEEGELNLADWLKSLTPLLETTPTRCLQDQTVPAPLRMAIDEALYELRSRQEGTPLHRLLGLPRVEEVSTTYALPVLPIEDIGEFIQKYDLTRFSSLKIKIDHHSSPETCAEVARHYRGPLWVDANQAFPSVPAARAFLDQIRHLPIVFIEQPFAKEDLKSHRQLRSLSPFPLFADESLQDQTLSPSLLEAFDGFNVKLLKAGSYQRALEQIEAAKTAKRPVLLGCMVETSVGIHAAYPLAAVTDFHDLDGFLYFAQEPQQRLVESAGKIRPRVSQNF